jgi:hypothetical protein
MPVAHPSVENFKPGVQPTRIAQMTARDAAVIARLLFILPGKFVVIIRAKSRTVYTRLGRESSEFRKQ